MARHDGWEALVPYDWEIRFDDNNNSAFIRSKASRTNIPFSIWRTGIDTPDDPSDDVRFVVEWFNYDSDVDWGMRAVDHDVSDNQDDPFTESIIAWAPIDLTPGQSGYDAWLAEPYSQVSWNLQSLPYFQTLDDTRVFSALVFVNLDGGDVSDGTLKNVNQRLPESGTIFRLETSTPPSPIPSAPAPGQVLEGGPISFYWSSFWKNAAIVQVSDDPAFENVLWETADVSSGVVSPSFETGVYFWRVTDPIGGESVSTRFEILTSTADEVQNIPNQFSLDSNYPNPFSGSTTISFSMEQTGHVRLEVFDALGRKVATILDGNRSLGSHQVSFNASGLSSGVYVYRLEANGSRQSRIMTVLK